MHDHTIPSDEQLSALIPGDQHEPRWFGDDGVYRWHSDGACDTNIVPSVLMAMEKYFYEQLDADADIHDLLQVVMECGHSLAFGGVLIDIGKYSPTLFLTALRPLLGVLTFYFWDRGIVQERAAFHAGLIGWALNQPEQLSKLASEWHTLKHRKYLLIEVARFLMLPSPELAAFFRDRIEEWKNEAGAEGLPDSVQTICAVLDRANYRDAHTDTGEPVLRCEMPPELEKRNVEGARLAQEELLLLTFPTSCRRWLDGTNGLAEEQLDDLWKTLQSIAQMEVDDPQSPSRKEDAVMGGIAVLISRHRDWLRRNPENEEWCLEQLRYVASNPPGYHSFDTPVSGSNWHWDYFVAECGTVLLTEDPHNAFYRRIVANGITAFHYGVTKQTMLRAFECADALGDILASLRYLAIRWSLIRRLRASAEQLLEYAKEVGGSPSEYADEGAWLERLESIAKYWHNQYAATIEQFVEGEVHPITLLDAQAQALATLNELERLRPTIWAHEPSEPPASYGRGRRARRGEFGLDASVVQEAFSWLGSPDAHKFVSAAERLSLVRHLLAVSMGTIPNPAASEAERLDERPNNFDLWLFAIISQIIPQVTRDDAASLWQPIFDLGPYAHSFVEMFLWHWFIEGVQSSTPEVFVEHWGAMIRYALESESWNCEQPLFYRLDKMVFELLGYHFDETMPADHRFARLLNERAELLAQAADRWFSMPRVLNGFARHATKPAYEEVLCRGMQWIHDGLANAIPDDLRHERDLDSNLIAVLHCCWERHPSRITGEPSLRRAFLGLMNWLASRGNHAAIDLRDRLLDSLRSQS